MPVFEYTARDSTGRLLAGALEATSDTLVSQRLREMGYFVTRLRRKSEPLQLESIFGFRRIRMAEIALFSRQFATMINAGLSLVHTLSILDEQATNPRFRAVIGDVRTEIEGGATLSHALEQHPAVFSNLFVNMVKAGETGGVLDDVLMRLATFLEKEMALRQKVKTATTYPILLAAAAVGALLFMTVVIIPQFATFFQEIGSGVQLPLATQIAMGVSMLIRHYWAAGIVLLLALAHGLRWYASTPGGRSCYDRLKLQLPMLGPVYRKIVLARFSRTLGTLVASGVPIMQALEVTSHAVDNQLVGQAIEAVRAGVKEGESIAMTLGLSGMFPPMIIQMTKVGEETGTLHTMLTKVADFFDAEVETTVNSLTSILEPVLIVAMGVVIGAMVIALYLPIFNLALSVR